MKPLNHAYTSKPIIGSASFKKNASAFVSERGKKSMKKRNLTNKSASHTYISHSLNSLANDARSTKRISFTL
jgi:hypothetical protein